MGTEVEIGELNVFEGLAPDALDALSQDVVELALDTGAFVLHQHDEAWAIYVLLSGSVEFLMTVEGVDDLFVGATSEPGALIGWSAVREPHRYTASVRCTEPCRVLRLSRRALAQVLRDDPRAGCRILQSVAEALVGRLEDARALLGRLPKTGPRQ